MSYEVLDEGSGPESTLPLDPLRPGTRVTTELSSYRVGGRYLSDGKVAQRRRADWLPEPIYGVPDDVKWPKLERDGPATTMSRRDGFVSVHAGWFDGPYPEGIVLVPPVVREGMRWSSGGYTFTVEARREAVETVYGHANVWTISAAEPSGAVSVRVYAEGIGFLGAPDDDGTPDPIGVMPLEDQPQAPASEPVARVPLTPLAPIGDDAVLAHTTERISVIDEAGRDSVLVSITGSIYVERTFLDYGFEPRHACLRIEDGTVTPIEPGTHASMGEDICMQSQNSAGFPRMWGHSEHALVTSDATYFRNDVTPMVVDDAAVLLSDSQTTFGQDLFLLESATNRHDVVGSDLSSFNLNVFGTPPRRHAVRHGASPMLLLEQEGWLAQTAFGSAPRRELTTRILGGTAMHPVLRVREGRSEITLASHDGVIDRLVFEGDELVRRRVGAVDLPDGAWLRGAAPLEGDTWLVFVQHVRGYEARLLGVYTAELPPTDAPEPLAPALGVTAHFDGSDIRVCWPQTDEPLDTAGWTIGGQPAAAVVPSGPQCALVMRDIDASPASATAEDPSLSVQWASAVGPVPGVGRTGVSLPYKNVGHGPVIQLDGRMVALADGGFIGASLFTPSGTRIAMPFPGDGGGGIADMTGLGLWGSSLIGPNYVEGDISGLTAVFPVAAAAAGGVVIRDNTQQLHYIAPDGSRTPITRPNPNLVATYLGRLSDGRNCELSPPSLTVDGTLLCYTDDGTEVSNITLPVGDPLRLLEVTPTQPAGILVPGDDTLLFREGDTSGSLLKIDPATGERTRLYDYDWTASVRFGDWFFDHERAWWTVTPGREGNQVALRIDDSGLTEHELDVDLAALIGSPDAFTSIKAIYPNEHVVLIDFCFNTLANATCNTGGTWLRFTRSKLLPK